MDFHSMNKQKRRIFFIYVKPVTFSGQSAASDLMLQVLSDRGWDCQVIPIHPLDRSISNPFRRYVSTTLKMISTWALLFSLVLRSRPVVHLNLGQSFGSMLRIAVPYFFARFIRKDMLVVISLHGSLFMGWPKDALLTRLFVFYLRSANKVTVLGMRQLERLIFLGLAGDKIRIVPNTCELTIFDDQQLEEKHQCPEKRSAVRLLHLSLLIESKGYPEYLEALQILADAPDCPPLDAILCGPMSFDSHCKRFVTPESKKKWIHQKINSIRSKAPKNVSIQWIPGAYGEEKRKLFNEAEIFVFPTLFPVEAQPLVLLEAMASGCSIITTTAGEIPSTVDHDAAIIMDEVTPAILAENIRSLAENRQKRHNMGRRGVYLMRHTFSIKSYGDNWEDIFQEILQGNN